MSLQTLIDGGGGLQEFVFPLPSGQHGAKSTWSVDQGVDVTAPAHTPLLAVGDGTIVRRGINGFGPDAPVLKLDQPGPGGERYVYYGHAGPGNAVRLGTHVHAGAVIGEVGAGIVGLSTGPHLEIGFSDAMGTPRGPKGNPTAHQMDSLLAGALGLKHGTNDPGGPPIALLPNVVPDAAKAAKELVSSILGGVNWAYIGIVVALVAAGTYMLGHGVLKTAGTPSPGGSQT